MQRLIKTPNTIEQSEINKAKRLLDTNPVMLYHGNQDAREQFLTIRRDDRLKNLQKGHTILDVLAENKEVGK